MISVLNSLNIAFRFTQKVKHAGGDLIKVTSFRQAEYRRYLQAVQMLYPMWVFLLNERPHMLSKYGHLVVDQVGYMIYRLQEIRNTNRLLPLLPSNEINFLLDTLTEMYSSLIEVSAPDALASFHEVILNYKF